MSDDPFVTARAAMDQMGEWVKVYAVFLAQTERSCREAGLSRQTAQDVTVSMADRLFALAMKGTE